MSEFIAVLMSGLSDGAVFALTAVGFLLIFKGTGVINFAQGDLITMGAFVLVWATTTVGLSWGLAIIVTILVMFGFGVLLERVAFAPLRSQNMTVCVVATLGASLMIQAMLEKWQGASLKSVPSPFANSVVSVGSTRIQVQQLVLIAVTIVVITALIWMFRHTSIGRDLRALANDRETAALYGVPVARLSMISWGAAAVLAALAGILAGPLAPIDLTFGFSLMFGAFGAAMLGGFGSIGGAAAASVLIGVGRELLGHYALENYSVIVPYLLIIAVIAVRPMGLLGRTQARL